MMAYRIMYGSEALFEPGNDDRPLHSARLSSKVGGVDQLTFVVPPSHPLRNSMRLRDLESSVTVDYGDQHLFCGFITRMVEQIDGQLAVTCVSDAQLLADVHVRVSDRLSAQMLFATVIGRYNQLMVAIGYDGRDGNPDRTFISRTDSIDYDSVGDIDPTLPATGPPTYVLGTVGTSPTTALDVIVNGIVQPYGCLMRTWRNSNNKRVIGIEMADYIDMLDDSHFGDSGQSVIFAENMTSYESDTSDEGFYTGCYPLGATDREYGGGSAGGKWLNIVSEVRLGDNVLGLAPADGVTFAVHANDIIVAMNIAYTVTADTVVIPTGSLVPISPNTPHAYPAGGRAWWAGSELLYTDSTVTLDRLPNGVYNTDFMVIGGVVYHIPMVRMYGLRTFTFSDSEIKDENALLNRAMTEIVAQYQFKRSVSVDAVDMAFYRDGYKHLLIGQMVQVEPKTLGQPLAMRVVEANLDLDDPSATRYTLGKTPDGLLARIRAARAETEALRDNLVYEVNNVIPQSTIGGLS